MNRSVISASVYWICVIGLAAVTVVIPWYQSSKAEKERVAEVASAQQTMQNLSSRLIAVEASLKEVPALRSKTHKVATGIYKTDEIAALEVNGSAEETVVYASGMASVLVNSGNVLVFAAENVQVIARGKANVTVYVRPTSAVTSTGIAYDKRQNVHVDALDDAVVRVFNKRANLTGNVRHRASVTVYGSSFMRKLHPQAVLREFDL